MTSVVPKTAVVVHPPTLWAKEEDRLLAIEKTAKAILANVSTPTLNTILAEIEAGAMVTFPSLAPILGDIQPFLADCEAISALIAQIQALKAVPVSQ